MSASINACAWYHSTKDGKAHAWISEHHSEYWSNHYLCGMLAENCVLLTDLHWGVTSPPPDDHDICETCLIAYAEMTL